MKLARLALILLGVAVLLALGFALLRRAPEPEGEKPPRKGGPVARAAPSTAPPPRAPSSPEIEPSRAGGVASTDGVQRLVAALARALEGNDRAAALAAARALRAVLLADRSLLAAAVSVLLDPQAPAALREAMAVVLGSLPAEAEGKSAIAEALRGGRLEGIERAALLSLAIEEHDDGQEFERENEPYGIEINEFFAVVVRGPLEDEAARNAALALLLTSAEDTRLAAARVLHDSTSFPEVRRAFLARLGEERDPEVAAEAGAALAEWSREVPPEDPERAHALGRLLDIVPLSDEALRFRLTAPLSSTPLTPEEADRLRALAAAPSEDARRFAVEVLGRRLDPRRAPGDESIAVLAQSALLDPSPPVREAAALALGRAASDPRASEALVKLLGEDADWEVRAAAARSLARAARSEAARSALAQAAASDPHSGVRTIAEEALVEPEGPAPVK